MNSKTPPPSNEDDSLDVLQGLTEEDTAAMNAQYDDVPKKQVIVVPSKPLPPPKTVTKLRPRGERAPQGVEAEILQRFEDNERATESVLLGSTAPKLNRQSEPEWNRLGAPDVSQQRRDQLEDHHRNIAEIEKRKSSQLLEDLGSLAGILKNPNVCDIWRNPDGSMIVKENGVGTYKLPAEYEMSDSQVMSLIGTVASLANIDSDEHHPYIETMLPRGQARFSAVKPPYTNSGPNFAIRRPGDNVITLDEYLSAGSITRTQVSSIRKAIRRRDNILIAGGTGSGKTTLANAIFAEIASMDDGPSVRFLILEDTPELRCPAENVVHYQTGPLMDMTSLLARCMRQSPTNISIGELRGKEAHVLIKAWNTGHSGGITTLHAKNARGALTRLENLIAESGMHATRHDISEAVNLIVVIAQNSKHTRTVTEVRRLTTPTSDDYHLLDA